MVKIPQRLLGEALLNSANECPDKIAVIAKRKEYSYTELKENALQLASYLISIGIRKGDRVAIYLNNSWQSAVAIYGATLSGAVFVVVNPQTKAGKLQYILNDSSAKVVISERNLTGELSEAVSGVESLIDIILSGGEGAFSDKDLKTSDFDEVLTRENQVRFPLIIPNDLAAMIYTSGSTGFPKGVMMAHQSMVFTSWSLVQYLRLTPEERIMLVLPLAFDYGLYQLLMSVTVGCTLIVEQSFTFPATIYKRIEEYQPTVFPGVPTIYAMMIASHKESGIKFDSIKKITNTAAALLADIIPNLKRIFPNSLIFKMYGLTECKRVCYLEPELIDVKTLSVGKAIPGTETLLLSPEGNPIAPNEPGILYVRGPHVMAGYWNKDELTAEMLKPGIVPGEKMLCTNDWFKMDEDGFLYFLGRNDDIIKTRGEKVSPIEVENIIYKIDGIREVAIMGMPDEILGESIVAYVTTHKNSELDEKTIQRECAAHLELFMIPQKIIFLNEMPKSSNGKIDKKQLNLNYSKNGQQ